ncbi:hypothetical protein [Lentzea sp.]
MQRSGGRTNGDVRLVVVTDDETRVVGVEQTTPTTSGGAAQTCRK